MAKRNTVWVLGTGILATALPAQAAGPFQQSLANAILTSACAITQTSNCQITAVDRQSIQSDIAEYAFTAKVGTGDHDVIRIHRVVRELAPGIARPASHAVFMMHGDLWGFDPAFLKSTLYFASHDLDVWGFDQRFVQVPAATTNFSFFQNWNLQTDVGDARVATSFARLARLVTGSGYEKLSLLGWSGGGTILYALANAETQLPAIERNIKDLLPVDIYYKVDPTNTAIIQGACSNYPLYEGAFQVGVTYNTTGSLAEAAGALATTNPTGPSPILTGLSNEQVALLFGTETFALSAPAQPPVPTYHYVAGTFDPVTGLPTGLQYTGKTQFYQLLQAASPYQGNGSLIDREAIACNQTATSYDNHLGDIHLPVFYVGAAGGFGATGVYTTTLLNSADVTTQIIQLHAADQPVVDFGHADLFQADSARDLVWAPIYQWITSH